MKILSCQWRKHSAYINLVVQDNALKRKNEETEEERRKLEQALRVMIEKKKKLHRTE